MILEFFIGTFFHFFDTDLLLIEMVNFPLDFCSCQNPAALAYCANNLGKERIFLLQAIYTFKAQLYNTVLCPYKTKCVEGGSANYHTQKSTEPEGCIEQNLLSC